MLSKVLFKIPGLPKRPFMLHVWVAHVDTRWSLYDVVKNNNKTPNCIKIYQKFISQKMDYSWCDYGSPVPFSSPIWRLGNRHLTTLANHHLFNCCRWLQNQTLLTHWQWRLHKESYHSFRSGNCLVHDKLSTCPQMGLLNMTLAKSINAE